MIVLLIKVIIDYKKDGNYGTTLSFALGLTYLILTSIWVGFVALLLILFLVAHGFLASYLKEIEHMGLGLITFLILLVLLIGLYSLYLVHMYFTVIKEKKDANEKIINKKDPGVEQTQKNESVNENSLSEKIEEKVEEKVEENLA